MYKRLSVLLFTVSATGHLFAKSPIDYQPLTVRDFEIDAEALIAAHKRVEISGAYTVAGKLDELYANTTQVAMVVQGISSAPFIPLDTTHASHDFRAAMFDCRSSGAFACMFTVRGIATRCTTESNFGVTRETACIVVEGGGRYAPPPPPPVLFIAPELGSKSGPPSAIEAARIKLECQNSAKNAGDRATDESGEITIAGVQKRRADYKREMASCMTAHGLNPGS